MSARDYTDLRQHIGHKVVVVCYGKKGEEPLNVAIECEDCNEVLLDYDRQTKTSQKKKADLHEARLNADELVWQFVKIKKTFPDAYEHIMSEMDIMDKEIERTNRILNS